MTTKNIDATPTLEAAGDEIGHILYSISWLEMVREIVGVYEGVSKTEITEGEVFENPE